MSLSLFIVFLLVKSCLLITLIKCLKGHKSLGLLLLTTVVKHVLAPRSHFSKPKKSIFYSAPLAGLFYEFPTEESGLMFYIIWWCHTLKWWRHTVVVETPRWCRRKKRWCRRKKDGAEEKKDGAEEKKMVQTRVEFSLASNCTPLQNTIDSDSWSWPGGWTLIWHIPRSAVNWIECVIRERPILNLAGDKLFMCCKCIFPKIDTCSTQALPIYVSFLDAIVSEWVSG